MKAYEEYLETGYAIDNELVMGWLKELSSGKNTPWQKYSGD